MVCLSLLGDSLYVPQYSPDNVPRGILIVLSSIPEVCFIKPTPLNHSIEFYLHQVEATTWRYNVECTVSDDFFEKNPCFMCSNISEEPIVFDGITIAPYQRNFIKANSNEKTITVVIDRHTIELNWNITVLEPQTFSA